MPHDDAVPASRDSSRTVAAGLLAWVWPGLGHVYLRRRGKGLVLMGAILALFVLGVAMDSRLQLHLGLEDPLALLFSLAQMGIGAPYFLARAVGYEAGVVTSATYEYGNTFTAVAGLLNILLILDALSEKQDSLGAEATLARRDLHSGSTRVSQARLRVPRAPYVGRDREGGY